MQLIWAFVAVGAILALSEWAESKRDKYSTTPGKHGVWIMDNATGDFMHCDFENSVIYCTNWQTMWEPI